MTAQDVRLVTDAEERQKRLEGYSAAEEITKLAELRDHGEISAEEYERLKERALV
jgi:uncharacterized membrane protein